jgi:hypothetical protein
VQQEQQQSARRSYDVDPLSLTGTPSSPPLKTILMSPRKTPTKSLTQREISTSFSDEAAAAAAANASVQSFVMKRIQGCAALYYFQDPDYSNSGSSTTSSTSTPRTNTATTSSDPSLPRLIVCDESESSSLALDMDVSTTCTRKRNSPSKYFHTTLVQGISIPTYDGVQQDSPANADDFWDNYFQLKNE